jgi:hypothetical protein
VVFKELTRARRNFILDTELHLVYQVTPIFHSIFLHYSIFYLCAHFAEFCFIL